MYVCMYAKISWNERTVMMAHFELSSNWIIDILYICGQFNFLFLLKCGWGLLYLLHFWRTETIFSNDSAGTSSSGRLQIVCIHTSPVNPLPVADRSELVFTLVIASSLITRRCQSKVLILLVR